MNSSTQTFTDWKKVQFGSGATFWKWFHLWVLHACFLKIQLPRDSTGCKSSKLHPFRSGWSCQGSMPSCRGWVRGHSAAEWRLGQRNNAPEFSNLQSEHRAPTVQFPLKLSWNRARTTRLFSAPPPAGVPVWFSLETELWPRPGEGAAGGPEVRRGNRQH